jgi:transcriptional regulator with XRE-family HTH domain
MKVQIEGVTRVRLVRDVVHYVKQWRTYRKLSLIALSERTNKFLTPSAISQLENGKIAYTQSSLQALAKALESRALAAARLPGTRRRSRSVAHHRPHEPPRNKSPAARIR